MVPGLRRRPHKRRIFYRRTCLGILRLQLRKRGTIKNEQPLNPLVQIRGAGVTEEQVKQVSRLLSEHELIKIKFNDFKEEKRDLSAVLEQKTESTFVRLIGNVLILYRPAKEAENRKFEKELSKLEK